MLIMETKNKLNYEVTLEDAYVGLFNLTVNFIYKDKEYSARANYVNGGWIEDVEVFDMEDNFIWDDDVNEIANEVIENMNINKDTISW